jgi:hypothetical protein
LLGKLGLPLSNTLTIRLQEHDKQGITDIIIRDKQTGFFAVIEAKINGWAGTDQLRRYARWMNTQRSSNRLLVALGVPPYSPDLATVRTVGRGIPLVLVRWADILAMVQEQRRRCFRAEKDLLRELEYFIEEVIGMQSYDREVLIRDLNVTYTSYQLYLDNNLYRCQTNESAEPLFFAPCITGAVSEANMGIQHFSRVYYREVVKMKDLDSIEVALEAARQIITKKIDRLEGKKTTQEQIAYLRSLPGKWKQGFKIARKDDKATQTVFFLGDPIRMPSALRKKGKMVPIGFSLSLEQLMSKGEGTFRC